MDKNKFVNKISSLLFYTGIITFFIAFGFAHNPGSGWKYQSMPHLDNSQIADITFTDSLTGYAVTGDGLGGNDTNYVLKTTNSGFKWNILFSKIYDFQRVIFINKDTGFVLHGDEILRTTNAGDNWSNIPVPPDNFGIYDMFVHSYDTLWVCLPFIGGNHLYRTTNSGVTWIKQLTNSSIRKIYFFNKDFGFVGASNIFLDVLFKTTDSGLNWQRITNSYGFKDIIFKDSLLGWKTLANFDSIQFTTTGGILWSKKLLPNGGIISSTAITDFNLLGKDTIWGVGGRVRYTGIKERGIVYRTTNFGQNWSYQIPDTAYSINNFNLIDFIDTKKGWTYSLFGEGIHTITGGDSNFITNIDDEKLPKPASFILFQNYPNPFNPLTKISYSINKKSKIVIKVFNILGNEIKTVVNEIQQSGDYMTDFNGADLPSGVYFYSIYLNGNLSDTKKMILLR